MESESASVPTPTKTAAPPAEVSTDYTSNPFLVVIKGLVSILRVNPVSSLLAALALIVGFIAALIVGGIFMAFGSVGRILGLLVLLASYILILPLLQGTYLSIATASNDEKEISTKEAINTGKQKLLSLLAFYIVYGLLVFIGLIFFIIPGVIIAARGALGPIIMYEENVGAWEALKRSFAITKGHTIEMLGVMFTGVFFGNGGLLLPSLMVAPSVARYNDLKQLKASGKASPKIHWLNYVSIVLVSLLTVAYFGFVAWSAHETSNARNNTLNTSDQYNSYLKDLQNSDPNMQ